MQFRHHNNLNNYDATTKLIINKNLNYLFSSFFLYLYKIKLNQSNNSMYYLHYFTSRELQFNILKETNLVDII